MPYKLNDQHFEQILRESAEKQYGYFLGHCAEWEEVWGLAEDGTNWAMTEDEEDGTVLFAVWPHPRFAEACRAGEWADREPTLIRLESFIDRLLPELIDEGTDLAVFPLPDGRYTPVEAERVRGDLQAEVETLEALE